MNEQALCPPNANVCMIGKHEMTLLRKIGPGLSRSWSVILRCKDQRSLLCCANDIRIGIGPRKCELYNAIFNSGAFYTDPIVR